MAKMIPSKVAATQEEMITRNQVSSIKGPAER